jgi:hydrogenase-4 component F
VVFILRSTHFKRMLAYSSIENMGIVCIGLTLGVPGRIAAMVHLMAHSLAKSGLFLTSGNISLQSKTKEIGSVTGLLRNDTPTGWLWIMGFLALSAMPPFPAFFSEIIIVKELLRSFPVLFILFGSFLVLILFGMGRNIFQMSFGAPVKGSVPECRSVFSYLPQILLLAVLLCAGLALSGTFMNVFIKAAAAGAM